MRKATIKIFESLSHPMRLRIVELLASGTETIAELAEQLPINSSSVHHHLQHFREAGVLEVQQQGRQNLLRIDRRRLEDAVANFARSVGVTLPKRIRPPRAGR